MKIKACLLASILLIGIATGCREGRREKESGLSDQPVSAFAQNWFSLDLQKQNYGARLETFPGLKLESRRRDVDWYWGQSSPDSRMTVLYGFQNDCFVGVEISAGGKERADKILADFNALQGVQKKSKFRKQSKTYEISYEGLCSPMENLIARVTFKQLSTSGVRP